MNEAKWKALIADDEPVARRGVRQLLASFPEGYRHLAYLQSRIGFKIKADMPGLKGAVVEALYARGAKWLQGAPSAFDEPPVALSLAGFIAARYTYEVLAGSDGMPSRAGVLAAFQRRRAVDLGGFHVSFDGQRRSASYVTQSMLAADGRVVG